LSPLGPEPGHQSWRTAGSPVNISSNSGAHCLEYLLSWKALECSQMKKGRGQKRRERKNNYLAPEFPTDTLEGRPLCAVERFITCCVGLKIKRCKISTTCFTSCWKCGLTGRGLWSIRNYHLCCNFENGTPKV
jgi:hypothetical protein